MQSIYRQTLLQLKDAAYNEYRRKDKLAISRMFNVEIKLAADTLLKWLT